MSQYIGVLGTPGTCQRGPGDQQLDKRFNPKWGQKCHLGYNLNQNEPFRIDQGHSGGTVSAPQYYQHNPAPQEWFAENYAPSGRNCKSCAPHRTMAFDDPYNWNSYYTSGHVVRGNKKEKFANVMLQGQDAPSGHDDGGMI